MFRHRALLALAAFAVFGTKGSRLEAQSQLVWETCSRTEGKGDDCGIGDQPRVFKEYLIPGEWAERSHSPWFFADFSWDVRHVQAGRLKVTWREVGSFGPHRIRSVTYLDGKSVIADLLLLESSRGIFAPLMKWSGQMPDPTLYETQGTKIVVIERDYGGNGGPAVATWAWVWVELGPVRLDLQSAVREAVQKVAPGHVPCCPTGLDWTTLGLHAYTLPEGKRTREVGVAEDVTGGFILHGAKLVLTHAEFRSSNGEARRWPQ